MSATTGRAVTASSGDPLAEAVELTRRLKLPHIRRHLVELVPTARAQRWDHAELVRVLLAEEAAGRDATNLRTRRARAGFPAGKTLHDWDAAASCIPRPTRTRSPAWSGSPGGRTSASAARPAPGRATSARRSGRPRSRPG